MNQKYIKKSRNYEVTPKIQRENYLSRNPMKRINTLNNFDRPIRNTTYIVHRREKSKDKTHVYGGECKIIIGGSSYKTNELKQKYATRTKNDNKFKEKSYIGLNKFNISHKNKISQNTIENKRKQSYQIVDLKNALYQRPEQDVKPNKRKQNKPNHTYYETNYRISPQLSHISNESSNIKKLSDALIKQNENFLNGLNKSFALFLRDLPKSLKASNEELVKRLSESQKASNEELVKRLSESQKDRDEKFIKSLIKELREENNTFIKELFKNKEEKIKKLNDLIIFRVILN